MPPGIEGLLDDEEVFGPPVPVQTAGQRVTAGGWPSGPHFLFNSAPHWVQFTPQITYCVPNLSVFGTFLLNNL